MPVSHEERVLRERTQKYWKDWKDGTSASEMLEEYIGGSERDGNGLLRAELDWARGQGRLPKRTCETLALLVGYSVEPLLQAICAYQPTRVILFLNRRYLSLVKGQSGTRDLLDWKQFGQIVKEAVCYLAQQTWFPRDPQRGLEHQNIVCQPIDEATPAHVFQALLKILRDDPNVLVDITGAKKSMVAGAFLYAAFANVPVTYVDFEDDKFDPEFNKPYGYACRIGELPNPYEKFALRDWERVRAQYRSHNFQSAIETLMRILSVMQGEGSLFTRDQQQWAQTLSETLQAYALWDNGDFHEAQKQMERLALPMPTAVSALGKDWPHADSASDLIAAYDDLQFGKLPSGERNPGQSIFLNLAYLIPYAEDEYAKLNRLITTYEDFRSALLRAAGLSEVLLRARLALAWRNGWMTYYKDKNLKNAVTPNEVERQRVFNALVSHQGVESMILTLQRAARKRHPGEPVSQDEPRAHLPLDLKDESGGRVGKFYATLGSAAPLTMHQFWSDAKFQPTDLADLRNRAIHVCLYVDRSLAQVAVNLARANLDEYKENWAKHLGTLPAPIVTDALKWKTLCERCGLNQFLPPNLTREEA